MPKTETGSNLVIPIPIQLSIGTQSALSGQIQYFIIIYIFAVEGEEEGFFRSDKRSQTRQ
jgi:hypothetical protein